MPGAQGGQKVLDPLGLEIYVNLEKRRKEKNKGLDRMGQLRVLVALSEDWGSILRTHMAAHNLL